MGCPAPLFLYFGIFISPPQTASLPIQFWDYSHSCSPIPMNVLKLLSIYSCSPIPMNVLKLLSIYSCSPIPMNVLKKKRKMLRCWFYIHRSHGLSTRPSSWQYIAVIGATTGPSSKQYIAVIGPTKRPSLGEMRRRYRTK